MKSMWDINPVLVTGHSENYGFNSVVTLGLTVTFSLLSIITLNFWTCGTFRTFPSTLSGLLSLPPIPAAHSHPKPSTWLAVTSAVDS